MKEQAMAYRAWRTLAGMTLLAASLPTGLPAQQPDPRALAVVDRAITLMGGADALRGIERAAFDMVTQWQRPGFRSVPWTDRPSFEPHFDVRDYTIRAWRNTRDFGTQKVTNVVRDSVAITDVGNGFVPQSVAYVDERDELFAYTPDRLVLLVRDAPDLSLAGDTLIGDERFTLVRGSLGGDLHATVGFHTGSGLPGLLRFRQGHPNDFGLVPWGDMRVEVWYSNWRTAGRISIPGQWDIIRAGQPYKRMTVRRATFNPQFAADSFAVSAPLRQAFLESRRPMHDRSIDSVSTPVPGLLAVHGFGFPAGALALGDGWLMLEAGHAPLNLERARLALKEAGMNRLDGAVVVAARAGNGGVVQLVRDNLPVHTSAAAEPFIRVMLENAGLPFRGVNVISTGRWIGSGDARVRLEPVDLPDVPGSLVLYAPALEWLYAPDAITDLDARIALDLARRNGWTVTRFGSARSLSVRPPAN
jgi:hypothetical protein